MTHSFSINGQAPVYMPINSLNEHELLNRITTRLRKSLELQDILDSTVEEVRAFLGTDRVKIYQFQPDHHGLVIAESLNAEHLPPLHGLNFPADDIPPLCQGTVFAGSTTHNCRFRSARYRRQSTPYDR